MLRTVRNICKPLSRTSLYARCFSSNSTITTSPWEQAEGVAVLEMKSAPVNAMSKEFIETLSSTISTLENDKSVQGVMITSGLPSIFMAGLDIQEMYNKDEEHLREFWTSLQSLWLQLNDTRLATVAAIEGHCPAGGCLLSLTCDERVMVDNPKFSIGLNETKLGIVAPTWFVDSFRSAIGQRQAERHLQLGSLLSPQDALAIGMVDVIKPKEEVRPTAATLLQQYISIPRGARLTTKKMVRAHYVEPLRKSREKDVQAFLKIIMTEQVQAGLGKYLDSLSKPKK